MVRNLANFLFALRRMRFLCGVVNPHSLSAVLISLMISSLGAAPPLRHPNTTISLPGEPPASVLSLESAFGLTFSNPVQIATAPGDTQRLWICEKAGDIELIPDVSTEPPIGTTFLDLDGVINARPQETFRSFGEEGLLSVAFHPDYATDGRFYTVYDVDVGGVRSQRLSCWTDPNPADNSGAGAIERVLIEMSNEKSNHNGGDLAFGPDGYLYMSWGDEGDQNDARNNSQFIDKDFWSSIIRIDVDLEPEDYTGNDGTGGDDANIAPNAHPAIVLHDGNPLYEVPADNPWLGATSFNGVAVDPGAVRTEFFAVGLRNPWRFSFDLLTGHLWVGDVGQGLWEEVSIVAKGSNHGWAWREGDQPGSKSGQLINGASENNAILTNPIWDYPHGSGQFAGNSVTGGFVYRGNRVPSLYGQYIFADYVKGHIWALDPAVPNPSGGNGVERIAGEGGIVAFGRDPSNGDVLLVDYQGPIHRLVASPVVGDFPQTLSATGFFADLTSLTPENGIVAYAPNLTFWSDFAEKSRWFVIKNTVDLIGYSEDDPWTFPEGMIWAKHFEMPVEWETFDRTINGAQVTDRRPVPGSARRRVETRFLVKTGGGSYGVSYRWDNITSGPQAEADLADLKGENFDIDISIDAVATTVPWEIPAQSSCLICHDPLAGHALSFNTRQLNAPGSIDSVQGNFVSLLAAAGYLNASPGAPVVLPRHVRPDETNYSLYARARSYLDVNCAYCHQSGGTGGGTWDGQARLTLNQTGMINGIAASAIHSGDLLVVPGDIDKSIIYNRTATANGYSRMPPLGSSEIDLEGIELLGDWIGEELQASLTFPQWRIVHFGDGISPEGEPLADPDRDGVTNQTEWLTNTNPNDWGSFWKPEIRREGSAVKIEFAGLSNTGVMAQRSFDLQNWFRWEIPDNDGVPLDPSGNHILSGPIPETREFFRLELREE